MGVLMDEELTGLPGQGSLGTSTGEQARPYGWHGGEGKMDSHQEMAGEEQGGEKMAEFMGTHFS